MPYYEVQNFAAGMDVRKSSMTAPAGTLRMLKNAVVNPGGEIEKRQAFVQFDQVEPGSKGLLRKGDFLWTVTANGATVQPTATTVGNLALQGMPVGIYEVLDYDQYGDKLYTIVRGDNGVVYHHYDGVLVPAGYGTACCTHKNKMYTVDGRYLRFSAVGNPADWAGTGASFIDLSSSDGEMLDCRTLEVYYDKLVIFSQRSCQLWTVAADPNLDQLTQTLRQAGIVAPKSARQYGSGDVLYLSQDGIRSLKSREQSLTAGVSDIGSPMDPYVIDLANIRGLDYMQHAMALLEPTNGRYWFITANEVMVLSNYPNPKIAAWSIFTPGFTATDAATANAFVYLRDTTGMVWRYGAGLATPVYDTTQAEVILPFLSFEKAATYKQMTALDVACQGQWDVSVGFNPGSETTEDLCGALNGPTFLQGQFSMMGHSTHCSLRFRSPAVAAGAKLSSLMIHYQETITT